MSGDFLLGEDVVSIVDLEEPVTVCADCKWHKTEREFPWLTKTHYCNAERTIDYVTGEPETYVVLCALRNRGNCKRFEKKETE